MQIKTIGHAAHSPEFFVQILKKFGINTLVDVRTVPYSKFASGFNRENLCTFLTENKIHYIYMGDLLGARHEDENLLDENGIVDFHKVFLRPNFLKGIDRLLDGVARGFSVCLMCAELHPISCHRFGMISQFLSLNFKDIKISHIYKISSSNSENLDDFRLTTQQELEQEILKKYLNYDGCGLNLYDTQNDIKLAYKMHNKNIGYRHKSAQESRL